MKVCDECKGVNLNDSKVCALCGAPLKVVQPQPQPQAQPQPQPKAQPQTAVQSEAASINVPGSGAQSNRVGGVPMPDAETRSTEVEGSVWEGIKENFRATERFTNLKTLVGWLKVAMIVCGIVFLIAGLYVWAVLGFWSALAIFAVGTIVSTAIGVKKETIELGLAQEENTRRTYMALERMMEMMEMMWKDRER